MIMSQRPGRAAVGFRQADIQDEIEHALRGATGQDISWATLAGSTDGPLPVGLMDGFDELLQASGVSQSDYLDRIVRLQQRESDHGRPVAVMVTSRTTVCDRVRIPVGTPIVRLEPFRPDQIGAWLAVWNRSNDGVLPGN
jgi:hypothetical protein